MVVCLNVTILLTKECELTSFHVTLDKFDGFLVGILKSSSQPHETQSLPNRTYTRNPQSLT